MNGDMAHGESPELDDAAWPIAKAGGYSNESVWFRQWIEVPKMLDGYDLTGTQISFLFQAGASGTLTQIIYVNGQRVAMGESLEPIVLL